MISKERAQTFLKEKEIKKVGKYYLSKINELSPKAQALGRLIINEDAEVKDESYYGEWTYVGEKRKAAIRKVLGQASGGKSVWDGEYQQVLEALFGKFANYVAKAWEMKSEMMYQGSYNRRSFRAPNNPETVLDKKIGWLSWLPYTLRYQLSLEEYVRYAGYLSSNSGLSYFLAGVIMSETEESERVFQVLLDVMYGRDEIGMMDRDLIKALLIANKPEGWEAVEKLLLSAQRQEGLRQSILESLDETSLSAFQHFIGVVLEHKLGRFSAVVRALDVWVGFCWESPRIQTVNRALELGLNFLKYPESIEKAVMGKDNMEIFMALWASGCHDIIQALEVVKKMLKTGSEMQKVLALAFLLLTELKEQMTEIAYPLLKEDSLMVAGMALFNLRELAANKYPHAFEALEALWHRVPEKGVEFHGKIFAWYRFDLHRHEVMGKMVQLAGAQTPERFLPFYEKMDLNSRTQLAHYLRNRKQFSTPQRELVFQMLSDKGSYVRNNVFFVLKTMTLEGTENRMVEDLLTRKSADLRLGAITVLMQQKDEDLWGSATRLLASKKGEQRLAGLDILTQLIKSNRLEKQALSLAKTYLERPKLTQKEQLILQDILATQEVSYTPENGFGLYDPTQLTPAPNPLPQPQLDFNLSQEKVLSEILKLRNLIEEYKDFEYEAISWSGEKDTYLVGNRLNYKTFRPSRNEDSKKWEGRDFLEDLPLWEVWEQWWKESSFTKWELELLNMTASSHEYGYSKKEEWILEILKKYYPIFNLKEEGDAPAYEYQIRMVISTINNAYPPDNQIDLQLSAAEACLAALPEDKWNAKAEKQTYGRNTNTWRAVDWMTNWLDAARRYSDNFTKAQLKKCWALFEWCYQTAEEKDDGHRANLELTIQAFQQKIISEHDLYDKVFNSPKSLETLTSKKDKTLIEKHPFLKEVLQKCRERILEIELKRGDTETLVTKQANSLQQIFGIEYLVQILQALGKDNLSRNVYYWSSTHSKNDILSTLLKRSFPKETEEIADFKKAFQAAKITDQRLIEVALYAPQWVSLIQQYLKWKGLSDAVWWLHAHTKEYGYSVQQKWESDMQKFTPLSAQDLVDGGVDVDWFHKAYKAVGKKHWAMLYKAARYISNGAGHKRAQLFADAMLKNINIKEVIKFIQEKRRQDHVRALGLLPLSSRIREKDLLNRYQIIQKFKKESKQFGNQRQTSEGLAVRIALENLTRTAGFSDPIRLTWAMETKEAQQIIENAEVFEKEGVRIQLIVDDLGKAGFLVKKEDKILKNIPSKWSKQKEVLLLKAAAKTLKNQYSRTRKALEESMCRGDVFQLSEITMLMAHPVVAPMLKRLVLVTESGEGIGYFEGGLLINPANEPFVLSEKSTLRIAHCTDLYTSKIWSDFQRDCFEQKRIQPFKQIFRELYLPTPDEQKSQTVSRRYAGHQVQPKKTVALLKGRGWTVDYEEGLQRVFHKENFVVRMYAQANWFTPSDVESPVLETIRFHKRDSYKEVPFDEIPPLIFSEIMRDIDLVVSVAHVGGVDPEASHSTVEMRKVLVMETANLLSFSNIQTKESHVLIKGELGDYSIHLGSGVVHRQPGGYISVLAVHGQHRGRLFLPFIDDDPKSAEILSKILLFAEDQKIKDPTILRQLV